MVLFPPNELGLLQCSWGENSVARQCRVHMEKPSHMAKLVHKPREKRFVLGPLWSCECRHGDVIFRCYGAPHVSEVHLREVMFWCKKVRTVSSLLSYYGY